MSATAQWTWFFSGWCCWCCFNSLASKQVPICLSPWTGSASRAERKQPSHNKYYLVTPRSAGAVSVYAEKIAIDMPDINREQLSWTCKLIRCPNMLVFTVSRRTIGRYWLLLQQHEGDTRSLPGIIFMAVPVTDCHVLFLRCTVSQALVGDVYNVVTGLISGACGLAFTGVRLPISFRC